MILLLFFVAIFAVMAFYIFGNVDRSFGTLDSSFVALFVTLTTASMPGMDGSHSHIA